MNLKNIKSILFVCTGNSCRSPMAEGLFRHLAETEFEIASAGTSAFGGMLPSLESVEVMHEHGINIVEYRSTPLTEELIKEYDLIVTMSSNHKEVIISNFPETMEKVFLLKEFSEDIDKQDLNILDPIGMPIEMYRQCADVIKKSILDLYNKVKK